jgi:hypothetical protein
LASAQTARARANDPDTIARFDALAKQYEELAMSVSAHAAMRAMPRAPAVSRRMAPVGRAMSAEEFWTAYSVAVAAINAVYGDRWAVVAPIGETTLVTVPGRFRSFKGRRGGTIRYRADHRMPAGKYWPGGSMPAALIQGEDYRREEPAVSRYLMLQRQHHGLLGELRDAYSKRRRRLGSDREFWRCEAFKLLDRIRALRAEIQAAEYDLPADAPVALQDDGARAAARGWMQHNGVWQVPLLVQQNLAVAEHAASRPAAPSTAGPNANGVKPFVSPMKRSPQTSPTSTQVMGRMVGYGKGR